MKIENREMFKKKVLERVMNRISNTPHFNEIEDRLEKLHALMDMVDIEFEKALREEEHERMKNSGTDKTRGTYYDA